MPRGGTGRRLRSSGEGPRPAGDARQLARPAGVVDARDPRKLTRAGLLRVVDIGTLQRTAGNAAVTRLVRNHQRRVSPVLQPKLMVGAANDPLEREADRMADLVLRRRWAEPAPMATDEADETHVRRVADPLHDPASGFEADASVAQRLSARRGSGHPLPDALRDRMEAGFGADFSAVRVHRDAEAAAMSTGLAARAFTHGADIYFGRGTYDPGSRSGQHLLAHELAHVVQQRGDRLGATEVQEQSLHGGSCVRQNVDLDIIPKRSGPRDGPTTIRKVQRAVGFEFEDPSWTVFQLQPQAQFRNPGDWFWNRASGGRVAPPGSELTDEERAAEAFRGQNIYQSDQSSHINSKVGDFNLQTAAKKGTLHTGPGYVIEPDGPYTENGVSNRMDLEIVTKPFPESAKGFESLMKALDDIQAVYRNLQRKASGPWDGSDFEFDRFVTPDDHGFSNRFIFLYGGEPGGDFKPQVTAGTSLSDVPAIMDTLGSPGFQGTESIEERSRRTAVRTAVYGKSAKQRGEAKLLADARKVAGRVTGALVSQKLVPETGTGALEGFLSLAAMYILALRQPDREGIKIRIPLLSRYSFATLFRQLSWETREYLASQQGRESLRAPLSRALLQVAPGTDIAGPMIATGQIYKGASAERVTPLERALGSFSRWQWLEQVLLHGRDLLTPGDLLQYLEGEAPQTDPDVGQQYGKSIAIYLRGHGASGNVQSVPGEERGGLALLENRAIAPTVSGLNAVTSRTPMSLDQVHEFAVGYFAWLMSMREAQALRRDRAHARRLAEDSHKARTLDLWGSR